MPKAKKDRADSSAKVARTEANKARRAARMKRKALTRGRGTRQGAAHKLAKNQRRRKAQNERAHALGYPNHAARRKAEKGKRLMPRREPAPHGAMTTSDVVGAVFA